MRPIRDPRHTARWRSEITWRLANVNESFFAPVVVAIRGGLTRCECGLVAARGPTRIVFDRGVIIITVKVGAFSRYVGIS